MMQDTQRKKDYLERWKLLVTRSFQAKTGQSTDGMCGVEDLDWDWIQQPLNALLSPLLVYASSCPFFHSEDVLRILSCST